MILRLLERGRRAIELGDVALLERFLILGLIDALELAEPRTLLAIVAVFGFLI